MVEADLFARQPICDQPGLARGFQQGVSTDDIGLDKQARVVDRAVDVGFGGEMDDVVD